MSAAKVDSSGKVTQLGGRVQPDIVVTAKDVEDTEKLARMLQQVLNDLAALKRQWAPRFTDFEELTMDATGTTKYRLRHGFGGKVRWWVVDSPELGAPDVQLQAHPDTDEDTLVLVSFSSVINIVVRVEEAG
jgi:hypothetical protein